MPPIIIAFFMLQGLGHGHTLLAEINPFGGPGGYTVEDRFTAWSSPRYEQWTRTDHCDITFFAVTNRRSEILTDEAFAVGNSLTVSKRLKADHVMKKHFLFANPDPPNEVYARRSVKVKCYGLPGSSQNRGLSAAELEGF